MIYFSGKATIILILFKKELLKKDLSGFRNLTGLFLALWA
jgi:hypothetical protein